MTTETIRNVIARFASSELRHVRRTLEAEMIAACKAGERGTQAHAGKLEMLDAIGAELSARNALVPPPPYQDVCWETIGGDPRTAVRLSSAVRCFGYFAD